FQFPAAIVYTTGVLILLVALWASSREPSDRQPTFSRPSLLLLCMVASTAALLYCVSAAGETRGLTVRYVLPFYPVLAAGVGLLAFEAWKFCRPLAWILLLTVVSFNVSGYYLPWSRERIYLRELMHSDTELVRYLENQRIRWVAGNYWVVY